jgi:hypothetical protein
MWPRSGRAAGKTGHAAESAHRVADAAGAEVKIKSRSVCETYRGFIETEVAKGCNAKVIFQGLVEDHG